MRIQYRLPASQTLIHGPRLAQVDRSGILMAQQTPDAQYLKEIILGIGE